AAAGPIQAARTACSATPSSGPETATLAVDATRHTRAAQRRPAAAQRARLRTPGLLFLGGRAGWLSPGRSGSQEAGAAGARGRSPGVYFETWGVGGSRGRRRQRRHGVGGTAPARWCQAADAMTALTSISGPETAPLGTGGGQDARAAQRRP